MSRFALRCVAAAVPIWLLACASASAQTRVTIADGRVTVTAKDATVGQILAEWARVGGVTVINLDRVPGGAMTLELTNVTENDALDVLLRSVGGYIATEREMPDGTRSRFDRVIVMPQTSARATSSAPSPTVAAPPRVVPAFVDADNRTPSGGFSSVEPQAAPAAAAPPPIFSGAVVQPARSTSAPEPEDANVPGPAPFANSPVGVATASGSAPPRASASTPGATGVGMSSGVSAPGMVIPVPPGLLQPAMSPSEYQTDPLKGSATPGVVVPRPSGAVPSPMPPSPPPQ